MSLINRIGNILIAALMIMIVACSSSVEEVSKSIVSPPTTSADPAGDTYNEALSVTLSCNAQNNRSCTIYYLADVNNEGNSLPLEYSAPINLEPNKKTVITYYGDDGIIVGDKSSQEYIIDIDKPIVCSVGRSGKFVTYRSYRSYNVII